MIFAAYFTGRHSLPDRWVSRTIENSCSRSGEDERYMLPHHWEFLWRPPWTPLNASLDQCSPSPSNMHNRSVNYHQHSVFKITVSKKFQTKDHCVSNPELAVVDCLLYFAIWLAWKHSPVLKIPVLMLKFEFFYSVILLCLNLPWKGKRVLIHFTAQGCPRKPELVHRGIQNMKTQRSHQMLIGEGHLFPEFTQHCRFRRLAKLELWRGWCTSL